VFGHVPLLTDPVFADYMHEYGKAGWKAMRYNRLKALGALYWYTVEFGLVQEAGKLKIYGAGILSGPREAVFALEAQSPNRNANSAVIDVDDVLHRGTQEYHLRGGRGSNADPV
jgi:phenylalanine-4-hydroxylase